MMANDKSIESGEYGNKPKKLNAKATAQRAIRQ
jgi:hypothetical protein